MMKSRSRKIIVTALILALAAAGSYLHFRQAAPQPEAGNTDPDDEGEHHLVFPPGAPQLAYIKTSRAVISPLPASEPLTARLALAENLTARIIPAVAGRILQLHAEIGDQVDTGAPLATMDSPDFGAAMADLHKAEANAVQKQLTYKRTQELLAGEAIARRDVENARAEWQIAAAEAERSRLRVKNLTPSGKVQGEKLVLRAPIAGVIVERQANPGTEIRPDQNVPLFVISNLSHLWVQVDVPERLIGRVHTGNPLLLSLDAFPGESFFATITRIAPQLDPDVRRIQVRAEIDNREGRLRPAMFARAQLIDPQAVNVVRLPAVSVITNGIYPTVFIETTPGQFIRRQIRIAFQDAESVWLEPENGGVQSGEEVVTDGAMLLASELAAGS
ncbi:efflux RND transporter periplasmic adaptor subunit [Nitrosomonas sp.]|uniref:efflux RND transporter periplasmic adaptor subunit n=1 Tax=Nitrosomonas sp. TaxID=42353 RepID=UPI0025FB1198|nr:efflux RND transporter periplasmic adaptor subunit [Nitrosomonas sp.]MCC6916979.1 efflux RND transporter periplasmic adaptor subunit [Nitrosomonas sp.]